MAKNIVIFSDGTGQGGGLLTDENRSNVYKLFRAARICPDISIDPAEQIAFYDYGLGSKAAGSDIKIGWWRWLYNILGQATGLGITRNIIDCYAAILRVWEPDDRIYLIGFSRGAYTVRCVAGVLSLCGIPTRSGPDQQLMRDPASAKAIATQAVKHVYQFGSSIKGDPYKSIRMELARRFREHYASAAPDHSTPSNAYPYFIGVWDTVATLGLTKGRTLVLGFGLDQHQKVMTAARARAEA
ncbi:phospholipase effector Tle1 domain-containing protein [Methylobacterium sp. D54C]